MLPSEPPAPRCPRRPVRRGDAVTRRGARFRTLRGAHLGLVVLLASGAAPLGAGILQDRSSLCGSLERSPVLLAQQLAPLGEAGRTALLALASSSTRAEVLCGIAGLAALGDTRAVPHIIRSLQSVTTRDDARAIVRWAAVLAGTADPAASAAMTPVLAALDEPDARQAAGDEVIGLLGEVDAPDARDRLLRMLGEPLADTTLDAVIHAVARQRDARAAGRIGALGDEALGAKSGNATPEQARRLAEVAFFQLAVDVASVPQGLVTLETIALRDREWAASWAVHTLCAAAVRRPAERPIIDAHRAELVAALDERGIAWHAPRGVLVCDGASP
jgi:hypothetical protein